MNAEMLSAWDRLNNAIKALLVAQPAGMSSAAAELASARLAYEALVQAAALSQIK
ncbi:hypothetical protein [Pseudomonas oryzihabitans]|uniref:hypothetical protein n=1 Tax=Pseudomonas oryzihabitans TaxID=47885 RepID=UPI0014759933|nr:hypothetical protein [Pseudomonas psychrotolerans]NMY91692.1 hypothetical protein [Pseudomonas psychrotolerans]NMY92095.1 hypothetical protein [Pseudomonas psychrotolerans]